MKMIWNSIIWGLVILTSAVILKGDENFTAMLITLIMGFVASDAVVSWKKDEGIKK